MVPITPVSLRTADGLVLDAEVDVPAGATVGVVIAHPHPQFGGDMRTPVVQGLFDRLGRSGVAVLRFDFRGVGRSEGRHEEGAGERLDLAAAVDALADRLDGAPVVAGGYSFGADVALAVDGPSVAAWFAAAPPLRLFDSFAAASDARPKLVAIPQHDQFNPPDRARPLVDGWEAARLEVVPGTDHFLGGRIDRVAALCLELADSVT